MNALLPPAVIDKGVATRAARRVSAGAAGRAAALDVDGAFPAADVLALRDEGLLAAFPRGGAGAEAAELAEVLRLLGRGSLPLGRLFEGHVNALRLIAEHADSARRRVWLADAAGGHLFGVWNTEDPRTSLLMRPAPGGWRLSGGKTFASGAGFVSRALVTARLADDPHGPPRMLVVPLAPGARADLSAWKAHGMRASATGTVDFTDLLVDDGEVLGAPGAYHAEPAFSAGAWRFVAVQLGGIEAVFDAWRDHLRATGRGGDPHQAARLGEGAMAVETAGQWVRRAAVLCAGPATDAQALVAWVNLARCAIERAGLEVLGLAQRSVGLQGFLRGHPLERLGRDLATYLRQPAPDRALAIAAAQVLASPAPAGELWPG